MERLFGIDLTPVKGSKIQLAGIQAHECGYCKSKEDTSISYGFVSPQILATDYEELMLRGFRRSGNYFYRPIQHRTCCPSYTIRLNVNNFQPSKSQKKVLRRSNKHLEKAVEKVLVKSDELPLQSQEKKIQGDLMETEKKEKEGGDESSSSDSIFMETEKASFTEEKYQLYKKYQVTVHGDKEEELSEKGFTRFLIESTLADNRKSFSSSSGFEFGTYHQLYRIRDTNALIAVGVIDILPSGLSSVYCFYDEDYRDLVLGKYTALKEIEFCQKHGFQYYYMGFYIHSCVKMRYKGEYKPSELLCCKTYQWFPLSECIPLLEEYKFTPFAQPFRDLRREFFLRFKTRQQEKTEKDGAKPEEEDTKDLERFIGKDSPSLSVDSVSLDLGETYPPMTVNRLTKQFQDYFTPILQEWIDCAGNDVAKRVQVMLY